jgi:hypothetical protein
MLEKTNLLGALTTIFIYVLYIVMFWLRLIGLVEIGHWVASLQFLTVIPFIYLFSQANKLDRPAIYKVQIALFLFFLLVELILDYLLIIPFREVQWMVITYVILFFAAAGGLLGVLAQLEDSRFTITGVVLFFIMAISAFVSRAVTGL